MAPQIHSDFTYTPNKRFYFTFGQAHHQGPERDRLSNCYTIIEAESAGEAVLQMQGRRGLKWGSIYESADVAGVDEFGLVLVNFYELKSQKGDNL